MIDRKKYRMWNILTILYASNKWCKMYTRNATQDCYCRSSTQQDNSCHQQTGLKCKEGTSELLHLELKLGHFGK